MKKLSIKLFIIITLLLINIALFSGPAEILIKAKQFYLNNKFYLAKDLYEKVLNKHPLNFNAEACLILGNIYDHQGQFALAIKLYERGIELSNEPKQKIVLYLNLAQSYRHAKKYVKSLEILQKVIQHADKHPEIFLYRGMAYFQLRNKDKTIENWETYLVKVPYGDQSDTIRKAIKWLRKPNFKWPEEIERERQVAQRQRRQQQEQAARRQRERLAELERKRREEQERARKFLEELRKQRERERLRRLQEQRDRVNIRTRQISPRDRGREEGQRYDEIER